MRHLVIAFVLFTPFQVTAKWEPPQNPNLQAILDEARADARDGRYEDALAKHVWFHNFALKHDRSYAGVRLSSALASWYQLGKAYAPAMEKLKQARDEARRQIFSRKDHARRMFIDMSAIDEQLGDEEKTVGTFIRLDKESPQTAKEVYDIAQPALVKTENFTVCGRFLEPKTSFAKMLKIYRLNLEMSEDEKSPDRKRVERDYAERRFLEESATLVALLVLNNRKMEAKKIAEKIQAESKHSNRDAIIVAAMEGSVPIKQ